MIATDLRAHDRAHGAAAVPDGAAFAVLDAPLSDGHFLVVTAVAKDQVLVGHDWSGRLKKVAYNIVGYGLVGRDESLILGSDYRSCSRKSFRMIACIEGWIIISISAWENNAKFKMKNIL